MDRTWIDINLDTLETTCQPMDAAIALRELSSLGIECDPQSFRALAGALGEPYAIANAWRRLASSVPDPDPFNVFAIVLWMELCPGRPCGDLAVVELAALSANESALPEEEFLQEAVARTVALGRLAYDMRPDAPGKWLRALIEACPGWDMLAWVVSLILRLHCARKRSAAQAVCRAWMPLLRDLWTGQPLLAEFPCLCLSGSPLVACCGRWGRG